MSTNEEITNMEEGGCNSPRKEDGICGPDSIVYVIQKVPLYVIAQLVGSILASGTLYLMFEVDEKSYFGTVPSGSDLQSFVMEILATFFLMFVGSAVTTDNRAIGELAGIAVGMTISVDLFIAGPVSGGSLNPARSLGPAIIMNIYDGIWIYMIGPFIGTITGCFAYTLIRFTKIPLKEMTKTSKFLKSVSMARPNHL
ncbi:putative aquaporin NIP-type [Senna tora]|uniref:Putative aquaporin NIP-type n=1 Tax=Senna tora TaxID=362788 RepID=A0A834TTU0_9FABA|nr:putative aquaporin NIP-type [Senna tora]